MMEDALEVSNRLQESERKIKTLLGNLPGMAYRCKNVPEWTMEFISDGCYNLTGYKPEEIIENTIISYHEIIHPDDKEFVWNEIQQALKEERHFELEYRIIAKGNRERWVWERGSCVSSHKDEPVIFEGFVSDITERKRAEKALQKSEARLVEAQRIAKMGDFIWDVETGEVTWSDALFDLLHYDTSEEFDYARVNAEIHHPSDLERVTQWLNDCIASGQTELTPNEYRIIRKDGHVLHIRTVGVIQRQEGNSAKIFATVQDITEREQAKEKLIKSEANLKSLINNRDDFIMSLDRNFRYTVFNNAFAHQFYKLHKTELTKGLSLLDYVSGDEKEFWVNVCERVFKGENVKFEYQYDLGGEMRHLQASINPIVEEGVITGLSFISIDITERKQVEEALRQSETRLIEAQRLVKMGDFTWDIETGEVLWSDALFDLLKYDKFEEIDYTRVNLEIHHPDDLERVTQWLNDCIASGKAELTPNEYRLIRKDGQVIHIRTVGVIQREAGKSTKIFATVQDITERKRAEEALRKSEELYREAQNTAHIAHWTFDPVTGISWWSEELYRIYGLDPADGPLMYEEHPKLIHPDDWQRVDVTFRDSVEKGMPYDLIFRILRPDGSERILNAICKPVTDDTGAVVQMGGTIQDITLLKQAEENIKHLNRVLRAIRNVNQLITKERRDRDRLLQNACERLTETGGYASAWLALLDDDGKPYKFAQSGLGAHAGRLAQQLEQPESIYCAQKALAQSGVQVIEDTQSQCGDCCLATVQNAKDALTIRLEYESKVYGILTVSLPPSVTPDEEEYQLFDEVAGDIAFALHTFEIDEKRTMAEAALENSLQEKIQLIQELYHRTKNNMQVIISMLMIQAGLRHSIYRIFRLYAGC